MFRVINDELITQNNTALNFLGFSKRCRNMHVLILYNLRHKIWIQRDSHWLWLPEWRLKLHPVKVSVKRLNQMAKYPMVMVLGCSDSQAGNPHKTYRCSRILSIIFYANGVPKRFSSFLYFSTLLSSSIPGSRHNFCIFIISAQIQRSQPLS